MWEYEKGFVCCTYYMYLSCYHALHISHNTCTCIGFLWNSQCLNWAHLPRAKKVNVHVNIASPRLWILSYIFHSIIGWLLSLVYVYFKPDRHNNRFMTSIAAVISDRFCVCLHNTNMSHTLYIHSCCTMDLLHFGIFIF